MIVLACAFAVVVAKHLYGGLGNNLFNPAMVGYAIMIIAYPQEMSQYLTPSLVHSGLLQTHDAVNAILFGRFPSHWSLDAMVSATPLDQLKTALSIKSDQPVVAELTHAEGVGGIAIADLIGGVLLLLQRIIAWQIPLGVLLGLSALAMPLHLYAPLEYPPVLFHLLSGGTVLCAFFIATDPVTAPTTPWGRFIFAFVIGLLIYIIRVWGGYPDGVAFAVLILNIAVPFIDQYTQPAVFGHKK